MERESLSIRLAKIIFVMVITLFVIFGTLLLVSKTRKFKESIKSQDDKKIEEIIDNSEHKKEEKKTIIPSENANNKNNENNNINHNENNSSTGNSNSNSINNIEPNNNSANNNNNSYTYIAVKKVIVGETIELDDYVDTTKIKDIDFTKEGIFELEEDYIIEAVKIGQTDVIIKNDDNSTKKMKLRSSVIENSKFTIALDNLESTTYIYEIYGKGIYSDSSLKTKMTTNSNAISIPKKENYDFNGYFTEPNGKGTLLIDKNGFITNDFNNTYFLKSSVIYANWILNSENPEQEENKYKVYKIYLDNQSATISGTSIIYEKYKNGLYLNNEVMTSDKNSIIIPKKDGYIFKGYYTEKEGKGIMLVDSTGYITNNFSSTYFNKNSTLYAKWDIDYVDKINGNRCYVDGNTRINYYITECQNIEGAICKYSAINGVSSNGTVLRNKLVTNMLECSTLTIKLDSQLANTTGSTTLYEAYGRGIYLSSQIKDTDLMTTNSNKISVPANSGYTFGGYYTEVNGKGIKLIDENGFITDKFTATFFSKAAILYAKWNAKDIYDVILFWGQSNMVGTAGLYPSEKVMDARLTKIGIDKFSNITNIDKEILRNYTKMNHVNVNVKDGTAYEYLYSSNSLVKISKDTEYLGETLKFASDGSLQKSNRVTYKAIEESYGTNMIPQFAKTYYEQTGHKVVAVFAANGGEEIAHFLPHNEVLLYSKSSDNNKKNQYIYEAMVLKYKAAIKYLEANNYKIGNKFYVAFQGGSNVPYIVNGTMTWKDYYNIFSKVHKNLRTNLDLDFGVIVETTYTVGYKVYDGVVGVHRAQESLISNNHDIILGSSYSWDKYVPDREHYNGTNYDLVLANAKYSVCYTPERSNLIHFNSAALSQIGLDSAVNAAKYIS